MTGRSLICVLATLCAVVIGGQLMHPLVFRDPTFRAVIETEITLSALAAVFLFALSFSHRRRMLDLLLIAGLLELALIDLASYVLPTAADLHAPGISMAAPLLGKLFMAASVAAGVTIYRHTLVPAGRKPLVLAIAGGALAAAVAEFGGVLLRGELAGLGRVDGHGFEAAIHHPISLVLVFAAATLLLLASVRISALCHGAGSGVATLLSAGLLMFAAARLNYLAMPSPGIDWVTAREGLRIGGFALILGAALRQEAAVRRAIAEVAATEERRRIARDLHDGLAQDLAFIAAHGDRIAREAGEDHPIAIAARRALAVSRGAIAELSAREAPTARAALRQVADELEPRFGLRIAVDANASDLAGSVREAVVRIVREAIANAAKADAGHVRVSLRVDGAQTVLRVRDDGAGIASGEIGPRPGFGLRSMRERADALGGHLHAHPVPGGGTELEVVFS